MSASYVVIRIGAFVEALTPFFHVRGRPSTNTSARSQLFRCLQIYSNALNWIARTCCICTLLALAFFSKICVASLSPLNTPVLSLSFETRDIYALELARKLTPTDPHETIFDVAMNALDAITRFGSVDTKAHHLAICLERLARASGDQARIRSAQLRMAWLEKKTSDRNISLIASHGFDLSGLEWQYRYLGTDLSPRAIERYLYDVRFVLGLPEFANNSGIRLRLLQRARTVAEDQLPPELAADWLAEFDLHLAELLLSLNQIGDAHLLLERVLIRAKQGSSASLDMRARWLQARAAIAVGAMTEAAEILNRLVDEHRTLAVPLPNFFGLLTEASLVNASINQCMTVDRMLAHVDRRSHHRFSSKTSASIELVQAKCLASRGATREAIRILNDVRSKHGDLVKTDSQLRVLTSEVGTLLALKQPSHLRLEIVEEFLRVSQQVAAQQGPRLVLVASELVGTSEKERHVALLARDRDAATLEAEKALSRERRDIGIVSVATAICIVWGFVVWRLMRRRPIPNLHVIADHTTHKTLDYTEFSFALASTFFLRRLFAHRQYLIVVRLVNFDDVVRALPLPLVSEGLEDMLGRIRRTVGADALLGRIGESTFVVGIRGQGRLPALATATSLYRELRRRPILQTSSGRFVFPEVSIARYSAKPNAVIATAVVIPVSETPTIGMPTGFQAK